MISNRDNHFGQNGTFFSRSCFFCWLETSNAAAITAGQADGVVSKLNETASRARTGVPLSANALRGYKDTTAMFLITFTANWLIGLPTGITLAMTDWIAPAMEARGFWVGFIVGLSAAAVMLGVRVRIIQRRIRSQLL